MALCARLLKNDELYNYFCSDCSPSDEELETEREEYLRAYNIVIEEISCEYFPLVTEEKITAENGKVKTSSLTKIPLKIKAVLNAENGEPVKYRLEDDCISADEKVVLVKYEYRAEPAQNENIECVFEKTIGNYVVAFGMAAQICFENGLMGEATVWKNKYDAALKGRLAERRKLIIKQRKWF